MLTPEFCGDESISGHDGWPMLSMTLIFGRFDYECMYSFHSSDTSLIKRAKHCSAPYIVGIRAWGHRHLNV